MPTMPLPFPGAVSPQPGPDATKRNADCLVAKTQTGLGFRRLSFSLCFGFAMFICDYSGLVPIHSGTLYGMEDDLSILQQTYSIHDNTVSPIAGQTCM